MRTIQYRRGSHKIIAKIDVDKPTQCIGCKRTKPVQLKRIHTHHWRYEYSFKEVRENPRLALHNTAPFCFTCHRRGADSLRKLYSFKPEVLGEICKTMPKDMQHQTIVMCRQIIRSLKENGL